MLLRPKQPYFYADMPPRVKLIDFMVCDSTPISARGHGEHCSHLPTRSSWHAFIYVPILLSRVRFGIAALILPAMWPG